MFAICERRSTLRDPDPLLAVLCIDGFFEPSREAADELRHFARAAYVGCEVRLTGTVAALSAKDRLLH